MTTLSVKQESNNNNNRQKIGIYLFINIYGMNWMNVYGDLSTDMIYLQAISHILAYTNNII
jgi:hypothetical protein